MDFRRLRFLYHILRDNHPLFPFHGWNIKHDVRHKPFHNGPQPPGAGFLLDCRIRDSVNGPFGEFQLNVVYGQRSLILLDYRVLRLGDDPLKVVRLSSSRQTVIGRRPMNSGIMPKRMRSSGWRAS